MVDDGTRTETGTGTQVMVGRWADRLAKEREWCWDGIGLGGRREEERHARVLIVLRRGDWRVLVVRRSRRVPAITSRAPSSGAETSSTVVVDDTAVV